VGPFETLALRWSPERPGNWVFHCHFAFHVSHNVSLTPMRDFSDVRPTGDHVHGMGGLVLGIHARQRGPRLLAASLPAVRPIRLLIRSQPRVYGEQPGYGYVLGGSPEESAEGPPPVPGPTLVLERGVPVAVSLVNQTHEPAAVHWHGIELDSYPDGVPGWSGEAGHVLPSIPPGDSLTVRFTPPRAGTFMYHSHFNELQQIASGLYGALLVVPPGGAADAERDRVLLFSLGGVPTDSAKVLLNGAWPPRPLELRGGVTQRLRLINIMANGGLQVALLRGDSLIRWTPVAKDGAELPAAQRGGRPSRVRILAGETYDFEVTPGAGDLVLRYVRTDRPPVLVPVRVTPMMAQASPP
jgi:FtsP/CotA-like multicopper oxidase with cupredoxin domain